MPEPTVPAGPRPDALVERRGHAMLITLNRPKARSAVDAEVCRLVAAAVEQAEHDADVRARRRQDHFTS